MKCFIKKSSQYFLLSIILCCSLSGCGGDLFGFDDNKNDVRDDVEAYVESLTFLTQMQRDSMMQMAQVYQHLFKAEFYTADKQINEAAINIIRNEIDLASNCMVHAFGTNQELFTSMVKALRRKVADNDTRADKVKEFDQLTQQVFYNETHFDGTEDTCLYNR